jgi:hypothetical protein
MLFPPQAEEQLPIHTRELPTAVEAQMTAPAEGDVPGRLFRPGAPMVDDQALKSQTHLAATVAAQHRFPMPAKTARGVPLPVIATPAQTTGE